MRRVAAALAPAAAYAALIFVLSSFSQPLAFAPDELLAHDKLLHLLEYALLGGLLARGLRVAGVRAGAAFAIGLAVASAFGATDEVHQAFVPGRTADVLDWVADTLGGAIGAAIGAFALRRPGGAG